MSNDEIASVPDEGDALDLATRFLCSDGACIGVIGADGRCKVCGAALADEDRGPFEAAFGRDAPRAESSVAEPDTEGQAESGPAQEGEEGEGEQEEGEGVGVKAASQPAEGAPAETSAGDFDPAARELCSDGACIGVIAADGRCKVCGKPTGAAEED